MVETTAAASGGSRRNPEPGCDGSAPLAHALRRTPELSGCGISWYIEEGALILRGCVRTFYQKQVAQTVATRLGGFERIVNELEVESSGNI